MSKSKNKKLDLDKVAGGQQQQIVKKKDKKGPKSFDFDKWNAIGMFKDEPHVKHY